MAPTYQVNLKDCLLEPEDWESLINDKEWKISLADSKETLVRSNSFASASDECDYGSLARGLSGVIDAASGIFKAAISYADRQNAEIQARAVLNRLRVANVYHESPYVGDVRTELLRLHRMALKGKYSVGTRTKIAQTRVHWVSSYLSSRPETIDSVVYKDLIELLSLVCTDEYPSALLQEIWHVFLEEMRSDGYVKQMASALVQCDAGEVYLILRHLAASYILAWSTIPSGQRVIESETDARQAARKLSFAWNTYDGYLSATDGFRRLIHGVLLESPSLVHAAFDDTRLHLLWLKFLPPDSKSLSYGRILDAVITPFLTYPKRLNPDLPLELQCIALFIATREPSKLAIQCSTHIAHSLSAFAHPEESTIDLQLVYATHPALASGELAHPALPFLLFAAELFRHSQHAAREAINSGILEAVFSLWRGEFSLIEGRSTGQWVHPEKRVKAMKLATSLALGALAIHEGLYSAFADRVVANEDDQETFWEITAFALAMQRVNEKWRMESCGTLRPLAFHVMRAYDVFPGDVNSAKVIEDENNIVWMLHASGDSAIDARIRTFALDVLIARIKAPSATWKPSVTILSACQPHERDALKAAFSEFVDHILRFSDDKLYPSNDRKDNNPSSPDPTPTRTLQVVGTTIPGRTVTTFMTNPLDRFVMFVSNASRSNPTVACAIAESDVLQLVKLLLSGEFDGKGKDVVTPPTRDWRRRTCTEMLMQRRIKESVVRRYWGGEGSEVKEREREGELKMRLSLDG